MNNPLRSPDPVDPFPPSRIIDESETGTRQPLRFQPKQNTTGNTQLQQRMCASRFLSGAAVIPSGAATNTVLSWATNNFDTSGLGSASGFTIPITGKITGPWRLHCMITWAAAAAGFRELNLYKGGSQVVRNHVLGLNDLQSLEVDKIFLDPPGSTVFSVKVNQTSGGDLNILAEPYHTFFEIIYQW